MPDYIFNSQFFYIFYSDYILIYKFFGDEMDYNIIQ